MSLGSVFDISGSALSAQSLRLNLTASNLANMQNVAGSPEEVYRARHAIFSAEESAFASEMSAQGVRILGVIESRSEPIERYDPGNPLANEQGLVYASSVNSMEEMANMMSASRSYQSNLEVINTTKDLLLRTLSLGQG